MYLICMRYDCVSQTVAALCSSVVIDLYVQGPVLGVLIGLLVPRFGRQRPTYDPTTTTNDNNDNNNNDDNNTNDSN